MKIKEEILELLINQLSNTLFETGGILGSSNADVIDYFILDDTSPTKQRCAYYPNVKFLNSEIEKWNEREIIFCGIIHTHFFDVCTLSDEDKEYVKTIMKAMPKHINKLFFPLFYYQAKNLLFIQHC